MNSPTATPAIVLFSTAEWFHPYWTNKQHIATRLGARGFNVLYIESIGFRQPGFNKNDLARIWRRIRRAASPVQKVQTNVSVLAPLTVPGSQHRSWAEQINTWQLQSRIELWLRRIGLSRPIVWTYHPYMLRVAKALNPTALVYHCVDNLGALPGINGRAFELAEDKLLAHCDRVFTTSPSLRDRCAAIAPNRTEYFGNVADVEHFSTARIAAPLPADLAVIPTPRLAYMGVLSDFKIDLELLEQIIIERPDWHLIFIGDERAGQHNSILSRLKTRSNVHFLGWKPYAQLPAYLRGIDVALLPQRLNDYTRAMFPMKYFEYLAAGRPIVATRLPALAEFTSLHREAETSQGFIDQIARALTAPSTVSIADPVLQSHSWDSRLDAMLNAIDSIRCRSGTAAAHCVDHQRR